MHKDLVILSKSKKYNNYCVAGKDVKTGEWIRLISEDDDIRNAVRPCDLIYENNEEVEVLDIVRVQVKEVEEHMVNLYQPENFILDNKYYLAKLDRAEFEELDEIIDDETIIFFNRRNNVPSEDLCNEQDIKSLIFIEPESVNIRRKNESRLWADVLYRGIWYEDITITDMEFTRNQYNNIPEGCEGEDFDDLKLVISLGENFNGRHYKLIATVIQSQYAINNKS